MSFVAPLWLAAAGLVGAGVFIAHLFSSTVPPQDVLPTVRFVPESTPLTVMRSRRVTDWLLLVLRLTIVALLGLALSGAQVSRTAPNRVVLLDVSRAVASLSVAADSAAALAGGGPIIVFDSTARRVSADDVRRLVTTGGQGSLSAAAAAAHRLIAEYAEGRDKTELVVVSPLVREEVDAATEPVFALWEGPIRFVQVQAARPVAPVATEVRTSGDDPVAIVTGSSGARGTAAVRVVRTLPTRADSQWASGGGALVVWPAANEAAVLTARAVPDSQGAIVAGGHVVVAPFLRAFEPRTGRAIARWADGAPAVTEVSLGAGCVREVAIPVDAVGDVVLRESFRGVVKALTAACGGARDFRPAQVVARGGSVAARGNAGTSSLPVILGLLALGLLVLEQTLRERRRAA